MNRLFSIVMNSLNSFSRIRSLIDVVPPEMIVECVAIQNGNINVQRLMNLPMGGYSRVRNEDGSFQRGNGGYYQCLKDIRDNIEEYALLYECLNDDTSREVFLNLMRFRLVPDKNFIKVAYNLSKQYPQYFAEDIFRCNEDEVFVDCGGYIGDTAEEFIKHCSNYKRIYAYEPDIENFNKYLSFAATQRDGGKDILVRNAGVGARNASASFGGKNSSGSFAAFQGMVSDNGDKLKILSIDDDIQEPVTFIKMDVECFELDAINGAAQHIANDNPKLAICLYHLVSDLWELPKRIAEINPNYKYYLRHYDGNQNWETVLYAIHGTAV